MDSEIERLVREYNVMVVFGDIETQGYVAYSETLGGQPVIFINENLSEQEQHLVILHELGHVALDRCDRCLYNRTNAMKLKMECYADTFMIERLVRYNLKGVDIVPEAFNYLDFMEQVGIPSKDESIVKEVVRKYMSENEFLDMENLG